MINSMLLQEYTGECGRQLIRPYQPCLVQTALFYHCAEGMYSVTTEYYYNILRGLLEHHGITKIRFINTKEEEIIRNG